MRFFLCMSIFCCNFACFFVPHSSGAPGNFNFWGERSTSEYSLLKRSFGTRTRRLPAMEEANMFNPLTGIRKDLNVDN